MQTDLLQGLLCIDTPSLVLSASPQPAEETRIRVKGKVTSLANCLDILMWLALGKQHRVPTHILGTEFQQHQPELSLKGHHFALCLEMIGKLVRTRYLP